MFKDFFFCPATWKQQENKFSHIIFIKCITFIKKVIQELQNVWLQEGFILPNKQKSHHNEGQFKSKLELEFFDKHVICHMIITYIQTFSLMFMWIKYLWSLLFTALTSTMSRPVTLYYIQSADVLYSQWPMTKMDCTIRTVRKSSWYN